MNDNEKEINDVVNFFDQLFSNMKIKPVNLIPTQVGWCNCCFREDKGHLVMYNEGGNIISLFICVHCRSECVPDEPCKLNQLDNGDYVNDCIVTEKS